MSSLTEPLKAPGKLLLFGEHAAVYGHPAVGIGLPLYLTLVTEPSDVLEMAFPDESVSEETISRFLRHLLSVAERNGLGPLEPVRLIVTSEIPIAGGFGSSAALSTVLARRLAAGWNGIGAPPVVPEGVLSGEAARYVWRLANDLEQFFHGRSSGVDTGLTTMGGVQAFRFTPPADVLPSTVPVSLPPAVLVAGTIPRSASTLELVAAVRSRRDADRPGVDGLLHRLGDLSETVMSGAAGTAGELGRLAGEAQELLAALGVSTPALDRILEAGRAAGALGGKLSGAGGGGAFFLVCSDEDTAGRVRQAIDPLLGPGGISFPVTLR